MIKATLISAVLAGMASAAFALTPVIEPDCEDALGTFYVYERFAGDLVVTEINGPAGWNEALISCATGQAVMAEPGPNYTISFYEVVEMMAQSNTRYGLSDVVARAEEAGWIARIESFDRDACVCGQ